MPKLIDFQLDKYERIIDEKVSQYKGQSRVKENPLIVLDGKPYRYDDLKKEKTLKVYADTISKHRFFAKEKGRGFVW